jgi:hypothetical protein
MKILLEPLLDWITSNVYDSGHGLLGPPSWVIDAETILDKLRELAGISKHEMTVAYDQARIRVHGRNVDGGTYLDEN